MWRNPAPACCRLGGQIQDRLYVQRRTVSSRGVSDPGASPTKDKARLGSATTTMLSVLPVDRPSWPPNPFTKSLRTVVRPMSASGDGYRHHAVSIELARQDPACADSVTEGNMTVSCFGESPLSHNPCGASDSCRPRPPAAAMEISSVAHNTRFCQNVGKVCLPD